MCYFPFDWRGRAAIQRPGKPHQANKQQVKPRHLLCPFGIWVRNSARKMRRLEIPLLPRYTRQP